LHMAQLMPLPLTVSCFSKIHIDFAFLVPAHPGSPGKRAVKWMCVCVCVAVVRCYDPTYQVNAGSGLCEPVPDCSVDHCLYGDCVVVAGSFVCNCYDGWSSTHCNVSAPRPPSKVTDSGVHPAAIIVPVIIGILLLREHFLRELFPDTAVMVQCTGWCRKTGFRMMLL